MIQDAWQTLGRPDTTPPGPTLVWSTGGETVKVGAASGNWGGRKLCRRTRTHGETETEACVHVYTRGSAQLPSRATEGRGRRLCVHAHDDGKLIVEVELERRARVRLRHARPILAFERGQLLLLPMWGQLGQTDQAARPTPTYALCSGVPLAFHIMPGPKACKGCVVRDDVT
jgi:hypothetical protein